MKSTFGHAIWDDLYFYYNRKGLLSSLRKKKVPTSSTSFIRIVTKIASLLFRLSSSHSRNVKSSEKKEWGFAESKGKSSESATAASSLQRLLFHVCCEFFFKKNSTILLHLNNYRMALIFCLFSRNSQPKSQERGRTHYLITIFHDSDLLSKILGTFSHFNDILGLSEPINFLKKIEIFPP